MSFIDYTTLNVPLKVIMDDIKAMELMKLPLELSQKPPPPRVNSYCLFYGHWSYNIGDCVNLKNKTEVLIRKNTYNTIIKVTKMLSDECANLGIIIKSMKSCDHQSRKLKIK